MTVARVVSFFLCLVCLVFSMQAANAQTNFFEPGWTLQPEASTVRFQSVKNLTKVESSGFVQFQGKIEADGEAEIRIFLDSVDTKIDLRNVRMRFLFFETFEFPEALISAKIDPAALTDLAKLRRKIIPFNFDLQLHGVTKSLETEVAVTLVGEDIVAVSSTAPISIAANDFNLDGGIKKLEEAANVAIVPSATVTFDFLFSKNTGQKIAEETRPEVTEAAATAIEPEGNLDEEACKGRFEILSRTDNIYFDSGSSSLDARSAPLLDSLVDIIVRCPDLKIEVGGHTDSVGSAAGNQRLSERRAAAVEAYISNQNVSETRITSVGYGETRPVASNDTPDGKRRNRRIEFTVVE
ncbi:OmpA family protein [uncultured Roseibium sp.]|uniref:OmpA family protein n=1 Tax=uncultured Roseibium sp. TaxID=1936171 RepID=UPI002631A8D5|nr:OmpA family protein [uncultured Roseibium sp.]